MMDKGFFSDPQNWQSASFRGVTFEVESHQTSAGRRLVRHEYPLRDTPWAEDLGRKAKDYQIEAFIVAGRKDYDYRTARDDLIKALDAPEAATLIHPTLGELTVAVDKASIKETNKDGGYCQITITFVEAGQREAPTAEPDSRAATTTTAATAWDAADDDFANRYRPEIEELSDLADTAADAIDSGLALAGLPATLLDNAQQNWAELVAYPDRLAAALRGIFGGYNRSGSAQPRISNRATASLDSLTRRSPAVWRPADAPPLPLTSDETLRRHIATVAVITAAEGTARTNYTTAQDAITSRNQTLTALDRVAAIAPDPLFGPLADLKRAVHLDLTTRAARLPHLTSIRLAASLPALVVAYKTHTDAKREAEIVTRNRVRNPCFCPAATALEVVKD